MKRPRQVRIKPGEYHVSKQNVIISTLLGSCVAACLYDPAERVVGMNHFLLSERRHNSNLPLCLTEAGRYGVHAMELLINGMLRLGARRRNLRAKAFGGGMVLNPAAKRDGFLKVAEMNVLFIRDFLEKDGIPLVSSDLGGTTGRVIYFCWDDFSVFVRKIKSPDAGLMKIEKAFWRRSLESREHRKEPELWMRQG